MVTRAYLLQESPVPSPPKLFLDQKVVPFLINLAGAVEAQLEAIAVQARARPAAALAVAFASGCVLDTVLRQRRR